ncbi:hypothetical protein LJ756_09160 [Arthrobacter sp. zg-Y411]|nr:hypothetical protein [Arthrobacter zhangbolii]MCC3294791.1 hypothetical protein [Arthrobacter zhangbolii]
MKGVILVSKVAGIAAAVLEIGSIVLFVLGGIFVAVGLFTLLKKNSSNRP